MERMERRGRRLQQLLDFLKQKKRYGKLKEEAIDRTRSEIALEDAMDLK
jgi:hypothetical protein